MTGLPAWYHPTHTDSDPCFLKIQCYLQCFWYFSLGSWPFIFPVHLSLFWNMYINPTTGGKTCSTIGFFCQVEHWTEAITQFFDGLGAWGAKQLISIAGRDCAIDWRAVIQRVISMGKPMGKPLCPYSGIVWLVKLNVEMWDDSWLFENLISHWRHISYFLIIVKMCSLKPRLPTAFKF